MKPSKATSPNLSSTPYERLSFRNIVQLAAPQTWTASILPFALATCLMYLSNEEILAQPLTICCLFLGCLSLQAAANTLNDYEDYVKGADSLTNVPDSFESTLLTSNINPAHVKTLSHCFVLVSFICSLYPLYKGGIAPLLLAIFGVLIVYTYSSGSMPLSYLPLGELVSSLAMGLLMPLGVALCLNPSLSYDMSALAILIIFLIPQVLSIALMMFTNNACDREKDRIAGRRTLAVLLTNKQVSRLYRVFMIIILVLTYLMPLMHALGILSFAGSPKGIGVATLCILGTISIASLLLILPLFFKLAHNPLVRESRIAAMSQCSMFYTMTSLSMCVLLLI